MTTRISSNVIFQHEIFAAENIPLQFYLAKPVCLVTIPKCG